MYDNLKRRYPSSFEIYECYKNDNPDFHAKNKIKSAWYLFRLILATHNDDLAGRVRPPKTDTHSQLSNIRSAGHKNDLTSFARISVTELAELMSGYDVITFDIFDTLIFRPFFRPEDVFYLLGTRLGYFNFKEIRMLAESEARKKSPSLDREINIYDIYRELAKRTGISPSAAEKEIALEEEICYANPYMLALFQTLIANNKRVVIVSDMYLPSSVLERILYKNGFRGYSALYVSCDYGASKSSGRLFKYVKRDFGESIIHIGDNLTADIGGARKAKIASYHYNRCSELGYHHGALISPLASMYRGIVNNFLYNGTCELNARERFAFAYAGPIAAGFCEWVNRLCEERSADRVFFLARDMKLVFQIYNKHYRCFENRYVIGSRFSLQELIIADYPEEYFYHTVKARCDRGYTLYKAMSELGLEGFLGIFESRGIGISDKITSVNLSDIKLVFMEHKDKIAAHFSENELAAKKYFAEMIGDARRICVADLGWRGSIIAYLKFLLVDKWQMCDEVFGTLIASTVNDSSVEFISDGTVTPYIYSHAHNRDFLTLHDWNKELIRIMTLEAVFTSEESSLLEYKNTHNGYDFLFGAKNRNAPIIEDFRRGVERFSDELESARGKYRSVLPISATDAFLPMHSVLENYAYIAEIIGDVVDTPYALSGLGIHERDYVPLGALLAERSLIPRWPIVKE